MEPANNSRVYVGGLGDNATMADLEKLFINHKPYTEATVLRGFAFIQFPSEEAAQNAIQGVHGVKFNGRNLTVKIANDNRAKRNNRGGGGGQNRGNNRQHQQGHFNNDGDNFRDRSPIDEKNRDFNNQDNWSNSNNYNNQGYGGGGGGNVGGGYGIQIDQRRQTNAFQEAPVQTGSDSNDCEIIVVSRDLTTFAENVENRLKRIGLSVDLLFPNDDVPIGKVLANIASRGSLYAILITPDNEEHNSITVNILYGQLAEHRNMPVEDALLFISKDFNERKRREKAGFYKNNQQNYQQSAIYDAPPLKDKHPEAIQNMVNLLAGNRQLTVLQYERLIQYLEERKEMQIKAELGDDADAGISQQILAQNAKSKAETEEELQKKILSILNKPSITTIVQPDPEPIAAPQKKPVFPSVSSQSQPQKKQELLHDPKVQKALDSLIHGNLFNF